MATNFGSMIQGISIVPSMLAAPQPAPTPTVAPSKATAGPMAAHVAAVPAPPALTSFGFQDGTTYDANQNLVSGTPAVPNPTTAANASLNSTQDAAMQGMSGTAPTAAEQMTQTAQSYFDNANANVAADVANQPANNLNQMAEDKYASLGIEDLQQKVADAQADLEKTQTSQADDVTQTELQYQGGGTDGFAQGQDALNQRSLKLDEIAKSIQLQTYQSLLSSKTDAWKEFNNVSATAQQQAISEWSTKLGLDKGDLTVGVQLLNQARQETDNDETQAKQLFTTFATTIPGFYQALSPADQQSIAQGKITPSMIATAGKLTQEIQVKNDVAQQRANTYMSGVTGVDTGLSQYGGPANGTSTLAATNDAQKNQISLARLGIAHGSTGYSVAAGLDGKTLANNVANTATSLAQLPPELRPYFQQKTNSGGGTYLISSLNKGQASEFASTYDKYLKANSSASYTPNPIPSDPGAYDTNQVAALVNQATSSGMGYTDIRAKMQSIGVPLTVYTAALKQVLSTPSKK